MGDFHEEERMSPEEPCFDVGSYSRTITATDQRVAMWFSRGLIWCYGFNHEEAMECFGNGLGYEGENAMCYWGMAYAMGPNYNIPWSMHTADERAKLVACSHEAVSSAAEYSDGVSPVEKALIKALQHRYPSDQPVEDYKPWSEDYARAMREVYEEFGDDLDVAALYADAMMNLTPWALWDLKSGLPARGAQTVEIRAVLEKAMTRPGGLSHPGILHLYIHVMEMSPIPEVALPTADRLRGLVPDSGHLNHMPTHIDLLCGDYARTMSTNLDAIHADDRYFKVRKYTPMLTIYRMHNSHFRTYGAMFAGCYQVAIESAIGIETLVPVETLKNEFGWFANFLEPFLGMRVHVYVRFGKWQELLDMPLPQDQKFYLFTTALTWYGKGIAASATGDLDKAEEFRSEFLYAAARVPPDRMLFNNKCSDILDIANTMLDGEMEYRKGNFEGAFELLRHAVVLDDSLPYEEPWGWMQPTRHALGALLLEQGHLEEALAVFEADLGISDTIPRPQRHINNVWALHGYHECLRRLGREEDGKKTRSLLEQATAVSDVSIRASCYCRQNIL